MSCGDHGVAGGVRDEDQRGRRVASCVVTSTHRSAERGAKLGGRVTRVVKFILKIAVRAPRAAADGESEAVSRGGLTSMSGSLPRALAPGGGRGGLRAVSRTRAPCTRLVSSGSRTVVSTVSDVDAATANEHCVTVSLCCRGLGIDVDSRKP